MKIQLINLRYEESLGKFKMKVLYFILIICISCSGNDKGVSLAGSFQYKDITDSYDSKTHIFSRSYGYKEDGSGLNTVQVKVFLTPEEEKLIWDSFRENKFQSFTDEIDCSSLNISPTQYDYLVLNRKKVKFMHNSESSWFCFNGKRFMKIKKVITDIILNKTEIKRLEVSNIGYE
ncbi:hypothetical protein [Elizabethkingia ursingii]|uniref:DUF4136 domain-containing protein n=1 Tax=Elizabethkingia ursingii TaxID=1756150 RepID=A0ABX3NA21_9FLAO|nr:hypothetical protein [Elizabethkingia ursingii]OPB91195.1 hypothetical protein BB021_04360 [Elizabethkingia ursingii]